MNDTNWMFAEFVIFGLLLLFIGWKFALFFLAVDLFFRWRFDV